jgi:hypothetical protein
MINPVIEPTTNARNARLGYKNLLTATTTSAASKMLIANTYERYTSSTGAHTIKFQLAASATIDFVGIAAHSAGTHDNGTSIIIKYAATVGGALTTIDVMEFDEENNAKMINFEPVTAAEVAITFTTSTAGLELGVIYAGEALEMERPIYGGHNPIDLSANTDYQNSKSESGNFLGRTVIRRGTETSYQFKHLSDEWIRQSFKPFMKSAIKYPFFIKWRPDLYQSTAFGFTTGDIKPSNMGGGSRLMEVSFTMQAHQGL